MPSAPKQQGRTVLRAALEQQRLVLALQLGQRQLARLQLHRDAVHLVAQQARLNLREDGKRSRGRKTEEHGASWCMDAEAHSAGCASLLHSAAAKGCQRRLQGAAPPA